MFGLKLMRRRTFDRPTRAEYVRVYKCGHEQGVVAGHSAQWHDGFNEGSRRQSDIEILNRTVKVDGGKVYTVRSMLDTLRGYARLMELKDAQIVLQQNRIVSLQGIIRVMDEDVRDRDDDDD